MPGPIKLRHGGNTSCVEVRVNGYTIILDAGTGIIPLGKELLNTARREKDQVEALLLLSHYHHDHTQGIPFFYPAYTAGSRLWVMGPELGSIKPQAALQDMMHPPYFPVKLGDLSADIRFETLYDKDQILLGKEFDGPIIHHAGEAATRSAPDGVRIQILQSSRHPGGVLVYRISWRDASVVYASDMENYPEGDDRLISFTQGTNLLIHDAQYTDAHYLGQDPERPNTQGYGHSCLSTACRVAQSSLAKKLVLFHHAPDYDDDRLDQIEAEAKTLYPETLMAYEGLKLDIE